MDLSEIRRKKGRRVTRAEFDEPWFREREKELAQKHRIHRKLWEFCAIAQVFADEKQYGGRVLGFGVGREPLPAWFASREAEVIATDKPDADYWLPDQHAKSLSELPYEGICSEKEFRSRVSFRPVDMLAIPEDLHGEFDFTWSASCFEHLGSIAAGLDFFVEQMKCLKPGGIAAHVTEYNFESNFATLEAHNLVAFRQRDIESMGHRLLAQNCALWPVDMFGGAMPEDQDVDEAPYREEPHLSLRLAGHVFTSLLLIASKG